MMIEITNEKLEVQSVLDAVDSEKSGAVNLFIGTVRNHTSGKSVDKLYYESYDKMVIKELEIIVNKAKSTFDIHKVAVTHRKGELKIGDMAVLIAVSSAHRKASFQACEYIIDTIKQTVPIWKREYFEDGEVWVNAHP